MSTKVNEPVMPLVLQGGVRRRRVRLPLLLLLSLAVAGATAAVWLGVAGAGGGPAIESAHAAAASPSFVGVKVMPERPPAALVSVQGRVARRDFSPPITAGAAALVDGRTGTLLWAKREHVQMAIASTTKIMTAAIAMERLAPRDVVTIHPSVPRAAPFREGLRAGERVQAWKLFYGLLLYSGNDDALALAIGAAGSRAAFLTLMNERARQLGLRNTHFTSPSGVIDRGNFSTAWDLATITRFAMQNPRFRTVVRTHTKRVAWPAPTYSKVYVNKNHLLRTYPGANGVKTGWTTIASHCLVASAQRNGVQLIAVVLHAGDAYGDVRHLLDYGFETRG
jgi:serine-type D-Ala-D-Ala carboxypeptidase (penicillin-binding protein 5/6)